MQGTHDIDETTTANDGDGLDPREAARLLAQTKRDARRQFNLSPPWISTVMGAVILFGYGALWVSTRGQHPYSGPSAAAIVLVYVAVAISIAVSVKLYRRATAGVSGPTVTQQKVEGAAIMLSYLGSPVIQGALKHYGATLAVVTAGMVALFVGASAAWLAAGIGLFIAVVGYAIATSNRLGRP